MLTIFGGVLEPTGGTANCADVAMARGVLKDRDGLQQPPLDVDDTDSLRDDDEDDERDAGQSLSSYQRGEPALSEPLSSHGEKTDGRGSSASSSV